MAQTILHGFMSQCQEEHLGLLQIGDASRSGRRLSLMVDSEPDTAEDERFTIDLLATRTGLTSRNIRALQTEGLLHGPQIEGRTGYYDASHLARLDLIARLQSEGFSRSSIATLLDAWDSGDGLAEVLGVGAEQPGILQADEHIHTTMASLRAWIGDEDWAIAELVGMRLATIDGDRVEILNPALFEIGRELSQAGLSLRSILRQARRLRDAVDDIAEHYIDELRTHLREGGTPRSSEADDLTAMLLRISPLIARSVDATLRQSMNDRLHEVLGDFDA